MRPNAYAPIEFYGALPAEKPRRSAFVGFFHDLISGWRSARADRDTRFALASLDETTLRDLGVETDEIERLRTTDAFLPRRWHTGN